MPNQDLPQTTPVLNQKPHVVTFLSLRLPPLLLCPSPLALLLLQLRVRALVPLQVAVRTTGVATELTAVGFLSCVGAGVSLQVDELRGCVRAHPAAVRLLALVDPHVALQVVGVTRRERAQRAREQLQLGRRLGDAPSPFPVCGASVRKVFRFGLGQR